MKSRILEERELFRATAVGVGVSVLTAAFMIAAANTGLSPLPKSLGLAFAEAIFRRPLPLPVGLLFHTLWVTGFSVLYVTLFRDTLTFLRALGLGTALWLFVLMFFFPIVGWGFLGLGVGPKLIVGAAIPHLLFSIFLWGLCRLVFNAPTRTLIQAATIDGTLRARRRAGTGSAGRLDPDRK